MTSQRIVVTGGAGFLGSYLCDRLAAEGHQVLCLDNLLTGSRRNIQHLLDQSHFAFIQADVTEPITVEGPVDFIFHFASPASPKDYLEHPIHTLKVGSLGTYHGLGLAKVKGATFILASSSEVYGDPEVTPQSESYWGHVNPIGPRSVYDEAKRFAEALAVAYSRVHGMDVRIVRIFNTYGPRMRIHDGRVMPTFLIQALTGLPLTVFGNGSQTRSFCYVGDMVQGIYQLATFPRTLKDEPVVVNIGSAEEVSILQLAHEVIEVTSSRSRIVFHPLPVDDPGRRKPDIARAKQLFGWEPNIPRLEGLRLCLPYFKSALSAKPLTR